ncbi:MAG: hypothetical protein ABW078_05515 [Sedimenticola sp.]
MNLKESVLKSIEDELRKIPDDGIDICDIGNSIAIAMHPFFNEKEGFSPTSFSYGIAHGIDLIGVNIIT